VAIESVMVRGTKHSLESRLKMSTASIKRERAKRYAKVTQRSAAEELSEICAQSFPPSRSGAQT
jgi:hypothetical protein